MNKSGQRRADKASVDLEIEDKFRKEEYSSTFDTNISSLSSDFDNNDVADGFPIALDPGFDLQALLMVRT